MWRWWWHFSNCTWKSKVESFWTTDARVTSSFVEESRVQRKHLFRRTLGSICQFTISNYLTRWFLTLSWCLKITEKVSFNIASVASYVYNLSGQKLIKNAQNGPFWRVFEKLKLAVIQCYQTSQFKIGQKWVENAKIQRGRENDANFSLFTFLSGTKRCSKSKAPIVYFFNCQPWIYALFMTNFYSLDLEEKCNNAVWEKSLWQRYMRLHIL